PPRTPAENDFADLWKLRQSFPNLPSVYTLVARPNLGHSFFGAGGPAILEAVNAAVPLRVDMYFFSAFGVEFIADARYVHSRLQPFRLDNGLAGVRGHSENIRPFGAFFGTTDRPDLH